MHGLSKEVKLRLWLLIVGIATLIIGTAYMMVQQSTRLAVNDMPLTTAQTAYHKLISGVPAMDVTAPVPTNLSTDSTVFTIITDSSSHILVSSAQLNGQSPLPPPGTFSYTKAHGSDHFTWQPAPGVRLATEMLSYGNGANSGFIITGQSLKQAENRINIDGEFAIAGWIGIVIWTTLLLYWPPVLASRSKAKK